MYKKNHSYYNHERFKNEAKSDVIIQWVRTDRWLCRQFLSQIKPNKSSIAWLRFSTFYYQSFRPKKANTVFTIRAPGIAMHVLSSCLEKLLDLIIN